MDERGFPGKDFINRRVDFQFAGVRLKLDLSLGLFSSAGVDSGTMLLLRSVARECPPDGPGRVLDAGCGTGALGLALAGRWGDAQVRMVDRDALAAAFAGHNARLNGLANVSVRHSLMLDDPPDGGFDLILSNFPAKAGDPVLADYLGRSTALLAPGGRGAIVIVHTLAERCGELIEAGGARVIHRDASRGHAVFHYAREGRGAGIRGGSDPEGDPPECYIRREGEFEAGGIRYRARTVWNMGDFDRLSWRLELMGELMGKLGGLGGSMVFWGPGQGHLPMLCLARGRRGPARVLLAGRDRLELLISRSNLRAPGPDVPVEIHGLADAGLLGDGDPGGWDCFVSDLSPVPRSEWAGPLREAAARLVCPGGIWAVLGRSADLAVLTRSLKGWTGVKDERRRGWRALVLRRNEGGRQRSVEEGRKGLHGSGWAGGPRGSRVSLARALCRAPRGGYGASRRA